MTARWLRVFGKPFDPPTRSSRRRTAPEAVLDVEMLEDRVTPSGGSPGPTLPIGFTPANSLTGTIHVPAGQPSSPASLPTFFYASQVISYVSGTLADPTYNNPSVALGGLDPVTGSFGGQTYYLTPFDPTFSSSELVEIGAGGSLVLKLAQTASTNGYTLGVHTGFGLADANYPNGVNSNPASYTNSWVRRADVQISADGVNWGDLGPITFNSPSNYDAGTATDPEGLTPGVAPAADPSQPFLGSLNSFDSENWQSTLATLNGSAGGTWINLTGVTDQNGNPITGVNYVKFAVPANPPLDPKTGNPEIMMVDAIVGRSNIPGISAFGGLGNITLSVAGIQGTVPGLVVSPTGTNTLTITGTPLTTGTETFVVTATDTAGTTATTTYSIDVSPNWQTSGAVSLPAQPSPLTTLPTSSSGPFVDGLYATLLGRHAEPGGLGYWESVLQTQGKSAVVHDILNSTEYRSAQVVNYYQTFLGRTPSANEVNYWVRAFQSGDTEQQVELGFVTSAEYQSAHGSPGLFVYGLYHDVLGRAPGSNELAFWTGSGLTESQIALQIINSPESLAGALQASYGAFLNRAGGNLEFSYWQGFLANNQDQLDAALIAFLTSPEFNQRAASGLV
jgi:hypothetical protein